MSLGSYAKSAALYTTACGLMPGGVNSPVRAFKAVGGSPLYIERAKGSHIFDVDGNEYIDYVSSWGAVVLGHANDSINQAIRDASLSGTSFGAPHAGEIKLAAEVVNRMPGVECVRFVNSGTEATQAVVRLARAATGRDRILKFEGHYHGALDPLLSKAGSGIATLGVPDSAGVPKEVAQSTITVPFNNIDAVKNALAQHQGEVAAILVEPVAGNMGVVLPDPHFLEQLSTLADESGALLVMDEVMTGFRVAVGGASELYSVAGDLAIMGKIIGGGLPVGAYGGRRELMELIAPVGPVYQAGTLSGNPLAMAAGLQALSNLNSDTYDNLEKVGYRLERGLKEACMSHGVSAQINRVGSMISVFFCPQPVHNFTDAQQTDRIVFARLFHELLKNGVYLPPSALESWFINNAHTDDDIDFTVEAFNKSLVAIKE